MLSNKERFDILSKHISKGRKNRLIESFLDKSGRATIKFKTNGDKKKLITMLESYSNVDVANVDDNTISINQEDFDSVVEFAESENIDVVDGSGVSSEELKTQDANDTIKTLAEELEIDEILESYDISSLDLKKGKVLEFYSLDDLGAIAKGIEKDVSDFFENGGEIIEVEIKNDEADTVNGIEVVVKSSGRVTLDDETIQKIKNNFENANLLESEVDKYELLTESHIKKIANSFNIKEAGKVVIALRERANGNKSKFQALPENIKSKIDSMVVLVESSQKLYDLEVAPRDGQIAQEVYHDGMWENAGITKSSTTSFESTNFDRMKEFEEELKMNGVEVLSNLVESESSRKFKVDQKIKVGNKTASVMFVNGDVVGYEMEDGETGVFVEGDKKSKKVKLLESDGDVPKLEYADVVLFNENGDVLLAKRSKNDIVEPEKYGFVGGKVELGEHPKDAAIRECYEESGIVPTNLKLICTIKNDDGTLSHYYYGETTNPKLKISDEHEELIFVEPSKIPSMSDIIFDNNDRYDKVVKLVESKGAKSDEEKLKSLADKINKKKLDIAEKKKDGKDVGKDELVLNKMEENQKYLSEYIKLKKEVENAEGDKKKSLIQKMKTLKDKHEKIIEDISKKISSVYSSATSHLGDDLLN